MDAEKYVQARLELIRRNSTYGLNFGKDYERPKQEYMESKENENADSN